MFTCDIDTSELERAWPEACRALSDGCRKGVARGVTEGAAQAQSAHPYHDRSGRLTGSIRGFVETSTTGGATGVIEAAAAHASFVEAGTAPHEIRAKGKALHWTGQGGERFAKVVHHPGTAPMPFMGPALLKAERVCVAEIETAEQVAARIMER